MFRLTLLCFISGVLFLTSHLANSKTRRCDASYAWQTTGGSIGPVPFGSFKAKGNCSFFENANKCRKRAKASVLRCSRTNWETRWEYHPLNSDGSSDGAYNQGKPEACTNASRVENYDLTRRCVTERKTGQHPNPNVVCDTDAHTNNIKKSVKVSNDGDIKSRLEAEVCCFYQDGAYNFSNNQKVHVRLLIKAWSNNDNNKHCKVNETLSPDYKINCTNIRERLCS